MNIGHIGHSAAAQPAHESSPTSPNNQSKPSASSNDPSSLLASATDSFMVNIIKNSLTMHQQLFDYAKEETDDDS